MSEHTQARLERWKTLWDISEAGPIIRRYFVMNFFDGVLTALGIVLGFFAIYLNGGETNRSQIFFVASVTAIAIGISGLTGSHLAESAERRLKILEMKQFLGLIDQNGIETGENGEKSKPRWSQNDLELALGQFEKISQSPVRKPKTKMAMLSLQLGLEPDQKSKFGILTENDKLLVEEQNGGEIELDDKIVEKPPSKKKNGEEKKHTLYEEAQEFASRAAAIVDGLSPFAGVVVVVLPFLFGTGEFASMTHYIFSFILTMGVLFLLGSYLATISRDSKLRYGMQMVMAAVFTSALSLFLNSMVRG